ncbi:MAG: hypothetical protein JWN94_27 [Betaproteobacteria bacterium]|nr:hypothetical protein [Betaproteobacteria bacterium]
MHAWAITCLAVAGIAAAAGYSGIAGKADTALYICAAVAGVLAIVFAIAGRRPPE